MVNSATAEEGIYEETPAPAPYQHLGQQDAVISLQVASWHVGDNH
jgi:hypothetical protein